MLGAFSLMCALSTFCCVALRDGFWVGFPFQVLGVVMGAFSIRLAREKKIAVSEIAVLGVMLSALALIGDVVWALFFVFRVQK
ncbi:MAG: hypothetical protein JNM17_23985 [Archangium sp.]|nr:hypothetical protein [Archangium sp.]